MNQIGFKNFRKFTNFPTIDLGDITILVGGNNAGKSTLVKAMLLMRDFLKSRIVGADKTNNVFKTFTSPEFNFDTEHVNVGDFYRAFCRQSPSQEDTISFSMKIDQFSFLVNIRGERKPDVLPKVTLITVADDNRDVFFDFDFDKAQMTVRFVYDNDALNTSLDTVSAIKKQKAQLEESLIRTTDLDEITKIKTEIEQINKQLFRQEKVGLVEEYDSVTIDMSNFIGDNIGKLIIPELVRGFLYYIDINRFGDKRSKSYKAIEGKIKYLEGKESQIFEIIQDLENVLNKQEIEYIYAHSVSQDSIYAKCANSSDYTKRTIHEFYNARISKGDAEFSLIEDWLVEFQIGTSLKVIPYMGDNYRIVIFDNDNPEITDSSDERYPGGLDLADKGMGSIQLVILLLRIATLVRKYKGRQLTVLLEEPEQNLHPAMQSKLAEFVYHVIRQFGVHFIIETHSEYLIRKTQVIVAEYYHYSDPKIIPFKVYYLPSDGTEPYEMEFRSDGKFSNEFGTGFFDTASNLAFELF